MSDTEPYLFLANCYTTRNHECNRIPSHWVGQEPHQVSWCQPRNSPATEILLAVSCQLVTTALYWKKYISWSISRCARCQRVCHWSAISCIRTSVRRRRGSMALPLALHDKEESFFINSRTHTAYCCRLPVYWGDSSSAGYSCCHGILTVTYSLLF